MSETQDGANVVLMPTHFSDYVRANWNELGVAPIFLQELCKEGAAFHAPFWDPEDIDEALNFYIGPDYADIKVTEWIRRMMGWGQRFPDGVPVYCIVKRLICEYFDGQSNC